MKTIARRIQALAAGGVVAALAAVFAVRLMGETIPGDVMIDPKAVDLSALDRVPAATWEELARKRIYFGHQSVGHDLIAGITDIRGSRPQIQLDVVETADLAGLPGPAFAHSGVGSNTDPESKIRDFVKHIEAAGPAGVDIAFLKFCYVDVTAATPVEKLFATYKEAMARIERDFPRTTLVHVSVPLTLPQSGLKARVKKLLGRQPEGYEDNRARAAFNAMLRTEYAGKRPFFDLAAAESTLPDGSAVRVEIGSDTIPCLAKCYTSDGGHLNETGRVVVAREALLVLAELAR
jgi:hypothetical protein